METVGGGRHETSGGPDILAMVLAREIVQIGARPLSTRSVYPKSNYAVVPSRVESCTAVDASAVGKS